MIEEDPVEPCPACGCQPDFWHVYSWNCRHDENETIPMPGAEYVVTCFNRDCPEFLKQLFYCGHPLDGVWFWNRAVRARRENENE